jgi:predicted TIM-barrel fold metal-dependent hydrolase
MPLYYMDPTIEGISLSWSSIENRACLIGRCFRYCHMSMFRAEAGPKQPGFQKLIDLLRHGEGRAWVKFTGTYRMATGPTFADAAPMARPLIAAAADRLIWGSDYPHLSFADKVGSVQLFNLLADWAPDEETRPRILVDNPAALFGFSR